MNLFPVLEIPEKEKKVAEQTLSLETLGLLDFGTASAIVNREIRDAVQDVDDRGTDGKERVVTIELRMRRLPNGTVNTEVLAHAKLPPRRSNATIGEFRATTQGEVVMKFFPGRARADQPPLPGIREDVEGEPPTE